MRYLRYMNRDYSKGKIYKISNDYNNDIYVGSTCDTLIKRFSAHKSKMYSKPSYPLYKLMIEIGCERFRIDLIEEIPCKDIYELRQNEGKWIREIGTLNKRIAGLSRKESVKLYNDKNKEYLKQYQKQWRIDNLGQKKK